MSDTEKPDHDGQAAEQPQEATPETADTSESAVTDEVSTPETEAEPDASAETAPELAPVEDAVIADAAADAADGVQEAVVEAEPEATAPVVEPEPEPEPEPEAVAESVEPEPVAATVDVEADAAPVEAEQDAASQDHVVLAAAGAAAVAAAAIAPEARPVWSDDGDAPFDDGDVRETAAPGARGGSRGRTVRKQQNEFVEIIKTVVFALGIAMVLKIVVFQPFTIPSASMEPNLYEGDYIIVSKWNYGYSRHAIPYSPPIFQGRIFGSEPRRGDVVVFKLPSDNRTDYIKRVIGLPGDRVQMIGGRLHINGEPVGVEVIGDIAGAGPFGSATLTLVDETLPEGRVYRTQDHSPDTHFDNTPVFEVPQGHYFMMGDNRDNSIDSRANVGLVPAENLVGKAQIVLLSWEPGASLFKPQTWFGNLRPSRFFTSLD